MLHHRHAASRGVALLLATCAITSPAVAMDTSTSTANASIELPFVAERWQGEGDVRFVKKEGFPQGTMTLSGDDSTLSADLKGFSFGNGTIEFDAKSASDGQVGIAFRKRDTTAGEIFYVRVGPNCPASQDCLQYAPIMHGRMLWDTYIHYQKPAPFVADQWNHIKMVVSGRRMNVYVNRQSTPSLSVGHLEGDDLTGGLSLRGPATYANLVVTPDAIEDLSPEPEADPSASDLRYVRTWDVAPPTRLAEGAEPRAVDMPSASAGWDTVHAEAYGLMNLARRNDAHLDDHTRPLIAWLKTSVQSDRDQTQHVSIGFLREVWVFVDGRLVYSDRNLYNTPGQRKNPDGRLSIDNGTFVLPLHKGTNHVVVAVRSNTQDMKDRYGWGIELRMENLTGVTLAP